MEKQKDRQIIIDKLSSDIGFYNNVFKKTEKIVSVTLYIVFETKTNKKTESQLESIKDKAMLTHEKSLETLSLQTSERKEGLSELQHHLVSLESTLRVASVSGIIADQVFSLLSEQIDSVLRYLNNHYLNDKGISLDDSVEEVRAKASGSKAVGTTTRQRRVRIPAGDISTDAYLVHSQMTDRAERIKTVLEAKPQATVKDISEVITDVSEKTIQRELNSLIEKGQVVREGERRWSRYSVAR